MYFHSNGKFLLTGEYLVTQGAKSLVMPLRPGQSLSVENEKHEISGFKWISTIKNNPWFEAFYDQNLNIRKTTDFAIAERLKGWLIHAKNLSNRDDSVLLDKIIRTNIEFDINWGLGSSSSLISNIAYLFDIDSFTLAFQTTNGSGYDVAAARNNKIFLYQLKKHQPVTKPVEFNPWFKKQMRFVFLGKKQNSSKSLEFFYKQNIQQKDIDAVSDLTESFIATSDLSTAIHNLKEHNSVIKKYLQQPSPGEIFFRDFEGIIKPLGAWGGDFALAITEKNNPYMKNYFDKKGFPVQFDFDSIIKTKL
jgi:mevalonate kinase